LLHLDKQPDASITTAGPGPDEDGLLLLIPPSLFSGMRSWSNCVSPPSYLVGKFLTQSLFWQTCILVEPLLFEAAKDHAVGIHERRQIEATVVKILLPEDSRDIIILSIVYITFD